MDRNRNRVGKYQDAPGRRSPELILLLHRADEFARRHGLPTLTDTKRMAGEVARQGRGGDTEIAHVAQGGKHIGKRKAFV